MGRESEKEETKKGNISFHFGFVVCRFGAASPLSLPLNCGFAADKLRSCPAAELDIFFAHAMPLSFRLSLTSSWTQPRRHICGRLKCLASCRRTAVVSGRQGGEWLVVGGSADWTPDLGVKSALAFGIFQFIPA